MNATLNPVSPTFRPVVQPRAVKRCVVLLDGKNILSLFVERWLLERFADFKQVHFSNGDDAWLDLTLNPPDLLITDRLHPGIDGIEILNRLSKLKVDYPVLMIGCNDWPAFEQLFNPWLQFRYLKSEPNLRDKFFRVLENLTSEPSVSSRRLAN